MIKVVKVDVLEHLKYEQLFVLIKGDATDVWHWKLKDDIPTITIPSREDLMAMKRECPGDCDVHCGGQCDCGSEGRNETLHEIADMMWPQNNKEEKK